MYVISPIAMLVTKSYIKNPEKSILPACTTKLAIKTNKPNFCFSFLSSSSKLGLTINTSPKNSIEDNIYIPVVPKPNLIKVAIKVNT